MGSFLNYRRVMIVTMFRFASIQFISFHNSQLQHQFTSQSTITFRTSLFSFSLLLFPHFYYSSTALLLTSTHFYQPFLEPMLFTFYILSHCHIVSYFSLNHIEQISLCLLSYSWLFFWHFDISNFRRFTSMSLNS